MSADKSTFTSSEPDVVPVLPLGNEDEFYGVGFARALYIPKGDSALPGNIVTGVLQKRLTDHWLAGATVNYEQFADRFTPRPTFDMFLEHRNDFFTLRGRAFLENIAANGETMRRDIFRTGGGGDLQWRISRRVEAGGNLQYSYWSDRNTQVEAGVRASYLASFLPCQWKFVATADYQSFAEAANDQANVPDLRGARHPDFAPDGYYFYQGRLEHTRVLSRDYFTHANSVWYSLQYGLGWDSNFVNFQMFRALVNADLSSSASVGLDFRTTISSAYNGVWAYAYVNLRWPLAGCAPSCP